MSEGAPLSRTTFNRHKDAIEDIFGIYIDCDRRDVCQWHEDAIKKYEEK
jgi:hypothetical protein